MPAGESTIQEVLDALAEQAATVTGIEAAYGSEIRQIQRLPCVIFSWFSDIDTTINTGSDQLWTVAAKAILYTEAIKGNELRPSLSTTNDLILTLVDTINKHPHTYPYGSQMAQLVGIDRINVTRVRPSEFGLTYAGQRFFGAELFLDIKMHRRITY
jgi:hypothetical protein